VQGLEQNGFGLFAATVPGAHWGNWRSLTRCDCKVGQQIYIYIYSIYMYVCMYVASHDATARLVDEAFIEQTDRRCFRYSDMRYLVATSPLVCACLWCGQSYSHCLTDLPPLSINSTYSNVKVRTRIQTACILSFHEATSNNQN
jgi:hypothetical protein